MPGTSLREIRLPGLQGVPPVLAAPGSEWHFCTGSLLCLDIIVLFRTPLVRRFSTRSRKKRKPTCTPYPYLATRQSSPRYRGQLFIQTRSWQRVLDTPHCRWITHPYRTRTSTRTCFTSKQFTLLARFQSNFDLPSFIFPFASPLLLLPFLTNRKHLLRKASLDHFLAMKHREIHFF